MNKLLVLLSVFAVGCLPVISSAQVFAGVKGGAGITTLKNVGNGGLGYRYKPGFSLPYSAFCELHLSKLLSLQIEVGHALMGGIKSGIYPLLHSRYSRAGSAFQYTDCPGETQLYYLTSGVMIRYNHPVANHCRAYFAIGGSPSLLLQAQEASIGRGNLYEDQAERTLVEANKYFNETPSSTGDYRSWNWAVKGCTGLSWELGNEYVLVELSASRGLTPVQRENMNGRNTTALYSLSVGFGFRL